MTRDLLRRLATFLLCGIVGVGVSASMLAGGLKKYKEWERSPQAYFLTTAERVVWAAIQTDGEAEKFIAAYLAQRGEKFRAELDQRIAMADKYLSFGKRKGSETLRGKVEKEARLFEEIAETLAQASKLSTPGVTPEAAPSN